MSKAINKAMVLGNCTKDPLIKTDQSGNSYVLFTIATNRFWKERSGEKREDTQFHRIIAWDKLGEICAKFCQQGKKIFVEGRMTTREYTTDEGKQRSITEIVASDVIFL